ncbi:hypothetical protein OHD60_18790 [Escherichia coli]|nr:hypothetical protein [Escherichia coli]
MAGMLWRFRDRYLPYLGRALTGDRGITCWRRSSGGCRKNTDVMRTMPEVAMFFDWDLRDI